MASKTLLTRDHYLSYSQDLENFVDRTLITLGNDRPTPIFTEPAVASALEKWLTPGESRMLAVVGKVEHSFPTHGSLIAASMLRLTGLRNMPIISHCCSITNVNKYAPRSSEYNGLMTLAYSLVRQLIGYIPIEGVRGIDVGAHQFAALAKPTTAWKDVLGLLRDLLRTQPTSLVVVIAGFQLLDDKSTAQHAQELLNVLREPARRDSNDKRGMRKVLFTTSGNSSALLEGLDEDNGEVEFVRHHMDSRGRPGRGLVPLRDYGGLLQIGNGVQDMTWPEALQLRRGGINR
ncbi:MAG: hypothetical protein Q9222_006279 [Ikaeria aurantiellina]